MRKLYGKEFLKFISLVEFVNNNKIPQSDIQCIIHENNCVILYYWKCL